MYLFSHVDDLACVRYNAANSLIANQKCDKDRNILYYLCGQFEVEKYRRLIKNANREIFFNVQKFLQKHNGKGKIL